MSALKQLPQILQEGDKLNEQDRILYLTDNILAGNMYDWGSTSIQELLKKGILPFLTAKVKNMEKHPMYTKRMLIYFLNFL